ncbi:hypothetical protein ACP8HI_18825 [Paenibacillus sp. FA6]
MSRSKDPEVVKSAQLIEDFIEEGGQINKTLNNLSKEGLNIWKRMGKFP